MKPLSDKYRPFSYGWFKADETDAKLEYLTLKQMTQVLERITDVKWDDSNAIVHGLNAKSRR